MATAVKWDDLEKIQRDAAASIGYDRDTWNAQFFSTDNKKTSQSDDDGDGRTSIEITLDNVHSVTTYQLRQELERRKAYDPKKHGSACYKNFLRVMVKLLETERLERDEKEMREKEKERLEELKNATMKRKQIKESRRETMRETKEVTTTAHRAKEEEDIETIRPSNMKPGTQRIPSLQMPRRF